MLVEVNKNEVVVQAESNQVEVVSVGTQGPSAALYIPGVTQANQDVLFDMISQNPVTVLIGMATPGSLTSDPVWRIKKIIVHSASNMNILWADGNTNPDNVWDNRAVLNYL